MQVIVFKFVPLSSTEELFSGYIILTPRRSNLNVTKEKNIMTGPN